MFIKPEELEVRGTVFHTRFLDKEKKFVSQEGKVREIVGNSWCIINYIGTDLAAMVPMKFGVRRLGLLKTREDADAYATHLSSTITA